MTSVEKNEELVTLRGVVTEADWDEKLRPIAIKLYTDQEEEFMIELNKRGRNLMRKHRSLVEVTGRVRLNRYGYPCITIKDYRVLSGDTFEESSTQNTNHFLREDYREANGSKASRKKRDGHPHRPIEARRHRNRDEEDDSASAQGSFIPE